MYGIKILNFQIEKKKKKKKGNEESWYEVLMEHSLQTKGEKYPQTTSL